MHTIGVASTARAVSHRICARCCSWQTLRIAAAAAASSSTTPSRAGHFAPSTASGAPYGGNSCYPRARLFSTTPPRAVAAATTSEPSPSQDPDSPTTRTEASSSSPPSPPKTHYDIFPKTLPLGPPPTGHFPIDVRRLRHEFLALQSRHHPDTQPPHLKSQAEAASALINEAYRTLANPLLRAQYLLALRGADVAADETLKVEDPDLLLIVLEAHETIADAQDEGDLASLRTTNEGRIAESEARLEVAFAQDDVPAAKDEAVRMRYWVNIRESLDNWEQGKPVVLQH